MIPLNPDWRKGIIGASNFAEWAASRPEASFYDLWEEIIDPEWLVRLAKIGGATQQQVTLAVCAVARLCLHLVPEWENRPRIAIETAEKWCRGEATQRKVRKARDESEDTYRIYSLLPCPAQHQILNAIDATTYAATNATNVSSHTYATAAVYSALRAGIESQVLCATIREHLVFERPPRPKGLTIWQRLAVED